MTSIIGFCIKFRVQTARLFSDRIANPGLSFLFSKVEFSRRARRRGISGGGYDRGIHICKGRQPVNMKDPRSTCIFVPVLTPVLTSTVFLVPLGLTRSNENFRL
jgi:hypothetical protein